MNDRFKFRIPMFSDKGTFIEFQYIELDDCIETTLCGYNGEPQQCTGLKDKNGELIYEGDIMLVYGKIKEVVYWGKRQFQLGRKHSYCANCKEIGYKRTCPTCYKYQSITATTSIKLFEESEVIGNIYENEELLNG